MSHAEGPYSGEGLLTDAQALAEARRQLDRQQGGRELTAADAAHLRDLMTNHLMTREEAIEALRLDPDDFAEPPSRELVQVIHDLSLPPDQRAKGHIWLIVTDARGQVTMAVEGVGGIERFEQDPVTAPRSPRDPATPGGIWYARFGMTEPQFHAGMQAESGERKSQGPRTYRTGNPGGGDAIRGEVLP